MDDEALEEQDTDSDRLAEVHKRALERFNDCALPQLEQRANSLFARRFVSIPGAQWEGDFGGSENPVRMEIDKVSRGLEKIVRDYRDNRIVPDFRPAGGKGDQETADTLDGLHRADSYHFKAQQARDNAFEEAAAGGMGAYRLTHEWADPSDKDSDEQRINPGLTIADADQCVFFDPDDKTYDKSKSRFGFVVTAKTKAAFEDEYGDNLTAWPDNRIVSTYDWFGGDIIRVAEYYEVEDVDEKLLIFTHSLSGEEQRHWSSEIDASEIADLRAKGWKSKRRSQSRRRVHKYVMSGAEVLKDQGLIAGPNIPIVPVYGKRWFVDNQERFAGYVQKKIDSQRIYNSQVSRLQETSAQSSREIPIFAAEQMPPALQTLWKRQVIDRHAYALVEPLKDDNGNIVSAGPIGKIEAPQLAPVDATLLQISNNDLTEDMQDADQTMSNVSADAMDIAATRIDAKSGMYLDNMGQSVQREGEIYLGMAAEIYVEDGREVETMTEDGDDGLATLKQPFTDKNGKSGLSNDFSRGKYKVIADVTEATATRRDKTVKSSLHVATVAQAAGNTDLANVALLTAVMNQDGEGMSDFQQYARKKLVGLGVVQPTDDEKAQMDEAAQQPDPNAVLVDAQAKALGASAGKDEALAGKAVADTKLSEAKVVDTLASAHKKAAETGAANDGSEPPPIRIRRGYELSAR